MLTARRRPLAFWADALTDDDLTIFKAKIGDPAWQSEWEILALLVSLHAFRRFLPRRTCIAVESDNTAVLEAATTLASGKALMNAVAAEVALILEEMDLQITFVEHVAGVNNYVADALSRLAQGKPLPQVLASSERVTAPARPRSFYRVWPEEWL